MAEPVRPKYNSFGQWFRYQFREKKLNTPFGYFFLTGIVLIYAFCIVALGIKTSTVVLVITAAGLLTVALFKNPYFGFYFLIAFSSFTITIDRIAPLPVTWGTAVELFTYLLLISVLLRYDLKKNFDFRFWTNPVSISLAILFVYYLLELFNPEMISRLGWLSYFKKQFSYLIFFAICYALLNSKARIIYFVRFAIAISTILALYACKQQWFGYAAFELQSIGTGNGYTLLYQGGMLRKFSVFSDPATSGILFASIVMLCIVLLYRTPHRKEKRWLWLALLINLLGYGYSGTRTATLMIIAGIILYSIATIYERRTVFFMLYAAIGLTCLMVFPFQNTIINRIRTTFKGTRDASAAVRDVNRHHVQPYIQTHPIGGGIFTSGAEGHKYNPGHYLEFLQADSGYLKMLAEQGPVGLALLLLFYFLLLSRGFHHYFRVRDPEIRTYYIGLIVMIFTLMVAQYAQMAITQYPIVLYFYAAGAIMIRLADFDGPYPRKTREI